MLCKCYQMSVNILFRPAACCCEERDGGDCTLGVLLYGFLLLRGIGVSSEEGRPHPIFYLYATSYNLSLIYPLILSCSEEGQS